MKKRYIVLLSLAVSMLTVFLCTIGINFYVKYSVKSRIITESDVVNYKYDAILVLGAGIRVDGSLSPMLRDRLDMAISIYQTDDVKKLILSGDHGQDDYDEVNAMKRYALSQGVLEEDIYLDHAGFSTYDSVYRAKEIFSLNNILIVTQEYHLYRALYISVQLGMDAYGVSSDARTYSGQSMRDFREYLARNKDFLKCILKPLPEYLGDKIDINEDGMITNG